MVRIWAPRVQIAAYDSLSAALYVPALSVYVAELFPTRWRSWATSSTWAVNRVGAAIAPFILLPLMSTQGVTAMSVVIAVTLLSSVMLVATLGPRGLARRPVG
jgi:putative MFS transporter